MRPRVEVSRPDKMLFPDDRITKAELAEYYAAVAEVMVPHTRGHPVMMQRFPNGIDRPGFVQKASTHAPAWVHLVEVPKKGGTVTHVMIDDAATLVWLADQACITPHLLLSRADRLDRPDRLIFDLDPWGDDPAGVRTAALWLRDLLTDLALPPLAMATGSRGVHLVIALDRAAGFDETRRFAWDVADLLARRHPDALTVETRRAARGGRLYLDILRNGYAQSTVAPYAVRPIKGAPVAVPLRWEEVEDKRFDPRRHTLRTTPERIRRDGDPWAGMTRRGRSLRQPRRRLDAMRGSEGGVSASPGA